MADDIAGIDDCIAVTALARRALLRQLVGEQLPACGRLFAHPRRPPPGDAFWSVIDTCACLRARVHEQGCLCVHGFERLVYRVDDDGRERYVTLPLR